MTNLLGQVDVAGGATEINCRLCGGVAHKQFSMAVLRRYPISYYRCSGCDSLQTDEPHWLAEAYKRHLSTLDTGAAQRNLTNLFAAYSLSRITQFRDVIDFGGGDGLLCRLLRDFGFNCFVHDAHAIPTYAQGFTTATFDRPEAVLAFEVLEHFAWPSKELDLIFESRPRTVLITTALYDRQGCDWWYLAPETGQHIFFYSVKAIHWIAKRYGYVAVIAGGYVVFCGGENLGVFKKFLIRIVLDRRVLRLAGAILILFGRPDVWTDQLSRREHAQSDQAA